MTYSVTYPDGTTKTITDRYHVTHVVAVKTPDGGWETWAGYGRRIDAAQDAACQFAHGISAKVLPVTPLHPAGM